MFFRLPPSCLSVNLKQLHYSIYIFFFFLNNHETSVAADNDEEPVIAL